MRIVPFEATDLELQADALTRLLQGKKPLAPLHSANHQQVAALFRAFKAGKKSVVFERAQPFYKEVLDPQRVTQAYLYLRGLSLDAPAEFEIVMDSLKSQYAKSIASSTQPEINIREALVQLLLAITQSDKNSISYARIDSATGGYRPTTFPLTPLFIQRFLAPFASEQQEVLSRTVHFHHQIVMGNPMAELAWQYRQRKQAFEEKQAVYLAAQQAQQERQAREVAAIPKASLEARSQVRAASASVKQLLAEVANPQEKAAVNATLQPDNLYGLLQAHQHSESSFNQKLQAIYAQKISRSQAGVLSARLASQMKRVLTQMEQWDESYWSDFQGMMQQLGLWEGQAWLDKWRSHKTGKQEREHHPVVYDVEPPKDELTEMFEREQRREDKRKGRLFMGGGPEGEIPDRWLNPKEPTASVEMQKVLQALSQKTNLQMLIELVLKPELWSQLSQSTQANVYTVFNRYSETDMRTIKAQLQKITPDEEAKTLRTVLAQLELKITGLIIRLEKNRKLVFKDVYDLLVIEQQSIQAKERQNSAEVKRSSAYQYGKYQ
jgi:hypothetical protein